MGNVSAMGWATKYVVVPSVVVCFFAGVLWAQSPVAYKAKVTYYDFHENGYNPEFEPPIMPGTTFGTKNRGLVLTTLDGNRKPQLNPAIPADSMYSVQNIAKWFIGWTAGDQDTLVRAADTSFRLKDSVYQCDSSIFLALGGDDPSLIICDWVKRYDTTFTPAGTVISDTLFKNITINDSLIFFWAPETVSTVVTNYYKLKAPNDSMTSDDFFPIDGRGFEALGSPRLVLKNGALMAHNYSFTMEIHNQFTYETGHKLIVTGDDDIWVYINNTLRIDLGGIHPTLGDTINLDNLSLTAGTAYNLDLFFAERHTTGSNLMIKANFVMDQRTNYTSIPSYPAAPALGVIHGQSAMQGHKRGMTVMLGNGVSVFAPLATHSIVYSIIDAQGHIVAAPVSQTVGVQSSLHLPNAGIFFVKAICLDKSGSNLSTSTSRMVSVR